MDNTPIRPQFPVEGKSLQEWQRAHLFALLDWFREEKRKEARPVQEPEVWDTFCEDIFKLEQMRETIP